MEEQNEQILTKKECRELKRQKKETEHSKVIRTNKTRKYLIRILVLAVIVILGYGIYVFSKSTAPQGEDFSQAIPVMGRNHIPDGSAPSVEYNSNPPTSGDHYGTPARPGFRDKEIPDGNLIHSMEHGLVWLSYHPRIGEEADKLRDITGPTVVTVPREANDTDIALVSWGRLDKFNLEDGTIDDDDLRRISDFVKRYSDTGPERIPAGQHGGI